MQPTFIFIAIAFIRIKRVVECVVVPITVVFTTTSLLCEFSCYRGVKVNRFGDLYDGRRAIFAAFV